MVGRAVIVCAAAFACVAVDAAAPPAAGAPPANSDAAPGDLASAIEPIRKTYKLPAMAAALVTPDGVEAIGFTGVRSKDAGAALEAGDRLHLGSCTKAMTATLAALLVRDGVLRWDSTVGEALGASMPSMDESWRGVTLEELLRHAGGAPADAPADAWARAWRCPDPSRDCRRAFVESLLSQPISQPRGTVVYSNQGYAIAGAMMEAAADSAYEALMAERLFAPLGITSAGFGPPPEASGHKVDGTPVKGDNPSAITPAGRAHMTMDDWAKFIALHLRRDGGDALPLTRADFDHLHSLAALPEDEKHVEAPAGGERGATPPNRRREGMALGWVVAQRGWGGRVLTHSGSNTLWFCVAWLAPERGFAMIAATNQGGPAATKACDEAAVIVHALHTARQAKRDREKSTVP